MSVGESLPRAGSSGGGGGGVVVGSGRPLSGVWSLLARLRRSPSQDSLSSAGSDATISFAFHSPPVSTHPHLSHHHAPLTDSYKKRVRDRNVRRQHDRDLTLHRKYGLPRGDATFDAFSLPHLPNVRRSLVEPTAARERRAASESLPRCAAHVPGKRRAPLPPRPASFVHTSSLGRRHSRKRPAPQPPPVNTQPITTDADVGKENIDNTLVNMKSNKCDQDKRPVCKGSLSYTPEKNSNSKKNSDKIKVPKMKREKSFLQQIFEGRKRSSAVEPPPERLLPNISELDKQAAEIIETYRLKPLAQNNRDNTTPNKSDAWFCTRCLRKYNSSVVTCLHCLPERNHLRNGITANHYKHTTKDTNIYTQIEDRDGNVASSSGVNGIAMEEKQKLKDILKEMKYALPKRSKHDTEEPQNICKTSEGQVIKAKNIPIKIDNNKESNRQIRQISEETETGNKRDSYYDPVTLRIGCEPETVIKPPADTQPSSTKQIAKQPSSVKNEVRVVNVKTESVKETAVITQPVVLVAPYPRQHGNKSEININSIPSTSKVNPPQDGKPIKPTHNDSTHSQQNIDKNINSGSNNPNSNEPVKLSSLLNPIYIPQQSNLHDRRRLFFSVNDTPTRESKSISKSGESDAKPGATSTATTVTGPKLSTSVELESTKENIRRHKEGTPSRQKAQTKLGKESTPPSVISKHFKPDTSSTSQDSPPKQKPVSTSSVSTSTSNTPISNLRISNANMVKMSVDQHSKRREWVNQLEQSIAKGDEQAAAQAATKLAQLRLACSVLSFSSQIVGEPSTSVTQAHNSPKPQNIAKTETNINQLKSLKPTQSTSKVNTSVQSIETVSPKGNSINNSSSKDAGSAMKSNSQTKLLLEPSPSEPDPSAKIVESNDSKGNLAGHSSSKSDKVAVGNGSNFVSISIWVEDREATRGPIRLSIPRHCTLRELRRRAEEALGLRGALQRWIVGRTLCTDDATVLANLAGPHLAAPFYLCVVADTKPKPGCSQIQSNTTNTTQTHDDTNARDVYSQLVLLERHALVPNLEPFECGVCMELCGVNAGAVLRECVHMFCRRCLSDLVRHCAEPTVSCPALGCPGTLQEREIRAVVDSHEYERWLARGLAAAESGSRNAFHCRTRDCAGWALCDSGVRRFPCPVCNNTNCIPCQTIHEGETCAEHRTRLQTAASTLGSTSTGTADTDEGTRQLLDQMIAKGEALQCPECNAIITKKWGCDWVKCSACKTEICWVTRGRRWGPGGRGDTSAGCRCGIDGRRCHPSCGYCH